MNRPVANHPFMWEAIEGLRRHTSHLHPLGDLVGHDIDSDGDCVCGPSAEPVKIDEFGGLGWMFVHAALDGRQLRERVADRG